MASPHGWIATHGAEELSPPVLAGEAGMGSALSRTIARYRAGKQLKNR